MSMLANAVASIRLGVDDFQAADQAALMYFPQFVTSSRS